MHAQNPHTHDLRAHDLQPTDPRPPAPGSGARQTGGFRLLEDPLTDHLIAMRLRRDALDAARELALATLRLTREPGPPQEDGVPGDGAPEDGAPDEGGPWDGDEGPGGESDLRSACAGHLEVLSDLRRASAGVALGLEAASSRSLTSALRWLWRASELADRAEQAGLLEMDEAMELLTLGSRVEIPLVVLVRKYGTEEV